MDLSVRVMLGMMVISAVKADLRHYGPQTFTDNVESNSPVALPPGYEMKEVTMYLTPSQIKALEAAHILVRADKVEKSHSFDEHKSEEQNCHHKYFQNTSEKQYLEDAYAENLANYDAGKLTSYARDPNYVPQVQEPNQENDFSSTTGLHQQQDLLHPEQSDLNAPPSGLPLDNHVGYAYIHFSAHGQPETNIKMFYPQPQEYKLPEHSQFQQEQQQEQQKQQQYDVQNELYSNQRNNWVPYVQETENNQHVQESNEKQLYQQFRRHLLQNPVLKNKRVFRFAGKKIRSTRKEPKEK